MRLYRWLLLLCPRLLRDEFGAAMEETFARRFADVGDAGVRRRAPGWGRELTSLIVVELDHGAASLNLPSGMGITLGLYYQYADRARTLDGVAIYRTDEVTLTGDGEPERIRVASTTTTLAPVMRVFPALGRWFTEEEGVPGARQVAVLSHGLWIRRYAGASGVIGRPIILAGVGAEGLGALPAS